MGEALRPMRVIAATDGSSSADTALRWVANAGWPAGSLISVVTVVPDAEFDRQGGEMLEQAATALAGLAAGDVEVTTTLLYGRPATRIVDKAAAAAADLIVVGSRGHGAVASMLLGSVAAEVVDHAAQPVLVARTDSLSRALLAHDGSDCANDAERVVSEWSIFATTPIDVLSVAELHAPWHLPSSSVLYGTTVHEYFSEPRKVLEAHSQVADAAAERLRAAGRDATPLMADGHVAEVVIRTAGQRGADLIVVGTRGRTGLTRAMLGSVARNVLLHSPTSVLVTCHRRGATD